MDRLVRPSLLGEGLARLRWIDPWPLLSSEGQLASLRLGWLASLDPHLPAVTFSGRIVGLTLPQMDRPVGYALLGKGKSASLGLG